MPDSPVNKYRAAIEVLHRGRDLLVESLADDILEQHENLMEGASSSTSSWRPRGRGCTSSG